jgi:hypothetical protein
MFTLILCGSAFGLGASIAHLCLSKRINQLENDNARLLSLIHESKRQERDRVAFITLCQEKGNFVAKTDPKLQEWMTKATKEKNNEPVELIITFGTHTSQKVIISEMRPFCAEILNSFKMPNGDPCMSAKVVRYMIPLIADHPSVTYISIPIVLTLP